MKKKKVLQHTQFDLVQFIVYLSVLRVGDAPWWAYFLWFLAFVMHIFYVIGCRNNEEVVDLETELNKKLDIEDVINEIRNEDKIGLN